MVTIEDVRAVARELPRSYEVLVRDRVKFRVGALVYLSFSRDETLLGFAFPLQERAEQVAADPARFLLPKPVDMRYNWLVVRLSTLDTAEMREILLDAWSMVVPKSVAAAHLQPD